MRDLPSINSAAVDRLVEGVRGELPTDKPILVASSVDLDDLRKSTTLGSLISEQIGSRLAQKGFTIKELKPRGGVLVQQRGGEFILSRDISRIRGMHDAQTVVAETYTVAMDVVYINQRLIRVADGRIVSAFDFSLPIGNNTMTLLAPNAKVHQIQTDTASRIR